MRKIYSPYKGKDGRFRVLIYERDESGVTKRKTQSYPRYLIENHLGIKLTEEETVDHIDDNKSNNEITNLQILSRVDNAKKLFIDRLELREKLIVFICP